MKEQPEKLDGESFDIAKEKRELLKQMFPSVFTETKNEKGVLVEKVDFEKLKAEMGTFTELFEKRRESYGMDWPGKKEALQLIQSPSYATLKPCREESVNFDTTENLFIEGDNLEVLKLMQKSYYGKIKMIYIDPPYNTGKEFIYPDNYTESLETYLEYAGLIDGDGKKFSTNTANEGRFHTRWLNMMYPRLYLARNLLREDGVIFISIDDNEVSNLRKICDEIFGEENSLVPFIWDLPRGINAGLIARSHEYIMAYTKNKELVSHFNRNNTSESDESTERCNRKIESRHPATPINFPAGIRYEGKNQTITGKIPGNEEVEIVGELIFKDGKLSKDVTLIAGWTMKDMIEDWLKGKEVIDLKGQKITEFFFKENGKLYSRKIMEVQSAKSVIKDCSDTQEGRKELIEIFNGKDIFNYPKPSKLLTFLMNLNAKDSDIVLDFFSGSSPTAHAILDLNKQDGGNRKFIMVQLPEPCADDSEAFKAGYKTIADIGMERIRRVIKKLNEEDDGKLDLENSADQDRGFRVLKLNKSNFKKWQLLEANTTPEEIEKALEGHIYHIETGTTQEDLLFEILIKAGFLPTEKVTSLTLANHKVYSVAEGKLLLCLEKDITKELIDLIVEVKPMQFICLDSAFDGNDQLKANTVQTFSAFNNQKDEHNQIIFRTV